MTKPFQLASYQSGQAGRQRKAFEPENNSKSAEASPPYLTAPPLCSLFPKWRGSDAFKLTIRHWKRWRWRTGTSFLAWVTTWMLWARKKTFKCRMWCQITNKCIFEKKINRSQSLFRVSVLISTFACHLAYLTPLRLPKGLSTSCFRRINKERALSILLLSMYIHKSNRRALQKRRKDTYKLEDTCITLEKQKWKVLLKKLSNFWTFPSPENSGLATHILYLCRKPFLLQPIPNCAPF